MRFLDWLSKVVRPKKMELIQETGGAERAREIVDGLRDDLELAADPGGMGWIFRRGFDAELWVAAVLQFVAEARAEGFRTGVTSMAPRVNWECACRCKGHSKFACPICLYVYGCPVHAGAESAMLRSDFLRDPERLAQALWANLRVVGEELDEPIGPWKSLTANYQRAMIESCRRTVSVRIKPE